jgi:hypothetical protein
MSTSSETGDNDVMKIHPAADMFPMLPDDELQALADDIKQNGLRHPIVLGLDDDGNECVIDGRNRLAARKLAGVEPTFVTHDGDARAFIMSTNIHRRHMSKGAQAMAVALLYPEPEKGGRGKRSGNPDGFGERPGQERNLLSNARTVLRFSRPLADSVLVGAKTLSAAYEEARAALAARLRDQDEVEQA